MKRLAVLILLALSSLYGEEVENSQKTKLVTVPEQYVSKEGMEHVNQSTMNSYVGIGKEVGEAIRTSLESVADVSNKFSGTPVGKLTIGLVIWKVVGKDVVRIIVGVPIFIFGLYVWFYVLRRCFFGYYRKTKNAEGVEVIEFVEPYEFQYGDGKIGIIFLLLISFIVWNLILFLGVLG